MEGWWWWEDSRSKYTGKKIEYLAWERCSGVKDIHLVILFTGHVRKRGAILDSWSRATRARFARSTHRRQVHRLCFGCKGRLSTLFPFASYNLLYPNAHIYRWRFDLKLTASSTKEFNSDRTLSIGNWVIPTVLLLCSWAAQGRGCPVIMGPGRLDTRLGPEWNLRRLSSWMMLVLCVSYRVYEIAPEDCLRARRSVGVLLWLHQYRNIGCLA